jgi:hypothetical protein
MQLALISRRDKLLRRIQDAPAKAVDEEDLIGYDECVSKHWFDGRSFSLSCLESQINGNLRCRNFSFCSY